MRVGWFGVYWNLETFGKKKKPYQPMSVYQLQSRSSISGSIRLSIQIGFRTPLP